MVSQVGLGGVVVFCWPGVVDRAVVSDSSDDMTMMNALGRATTFTER